MNPVLRESVARSMWVKTVAEAYGRLRSGCDMDPMLREEHALDAAEGSCSSALPFTFRVPQGPVAQREWRALDAGEASGRSVGRLRSGCHMDSVLRESSTHLWRVKILTGAYRRLCSAGLTDPALRKSSTRLWRVKPPAGAYRHLRSSGPIEPVLREAARACGG
ncbi:hypothetical protein MRX96_017387 [Rhipicephalus microplus]